MVDIDDDNEDVVLDDNTPTTVTLIYEDNGGIEQSYEIDLTYSQIRTIATVFTSIHEDITGESK